jgi:hypothetical protein
MSLSNDNIIITAKSEAVNIDILPSTGDVDITTIPQYITVQVGATVTTSSGSFVIGETPSGAVNGSNATFTTAQNFVPESLQVFINGVSQTSGVDFITTGSTTITLTVSPVSGDYIRVNYKLG